MQVEHFDVLIVGAGSHLGIHAASANGPVFVAQDLITYAWDGAATVVSKPIEQMAHGSTGTRYQIFH